MASRIAAIRKYRPEIRLMRTMQTPHVVEFIARETGLNEGEIRFVVYEMRDTVLIAARQGQPVKLEGLGTFTPTLRMDGSLDLSFRPDPRLLEQLNDKTQFTGEIINKGNIGKSVGDLVVQWNQEHPENPAE